LLKITFAEIESKQFMLEAQLCYNSSMKKLLELSQKPKSDSSRLLAHPPKFQAMLVQGRAQAKVGKTVPFDAFWQEAERRQNKNVSIKTS
jgi:hypothetical protein